MSKKNREIKELKKQNEKLKSLLLDIKEQLEGLRKEVSNIIPEVHHHYHNDIVSNPLDPPFIVTCEKSSGNPYVQEPSTTEPFKATFDSAVNFNYISSNVN